MNLNKTLKEERRRKLIEVVSKMLDEKMDLFEGTGEILALSDAVDGPRQPIFLPFRGIDSETHHYPTKKSFRAYCSTEFLRRMDTERERHLEESREYILAACRELLRFLNDRQE